MFDVIEEKGITALKSRKTAKFNGQTMDALETIFYPEEKVEEMEKVLLKKKGDTCRIKTVGIVDFETSDLDEPFKLRVQFKDKDSNVKEYSYKIK